MERAAVFLDGGYIDRAKELPKRYELDFRLLAERLAGGIPLLRVYYYHCMPLQGSTPSPRESERYANMRSFLSKLEMIPSFEVRLGRLMTYKDESGRDIYKQKQVDVLLSLDLVSLAYRKAISTAILVAGDSDFVPAIKLAKAEGVETVLYYSPSAPTHNELLKAVDKRIALSRSLLL
jgi:uncharacterized LabA/DUF88 family protein